MLNTGDESRGFSRELSVNCPTWDGHDVPELHEVSRSYFDWLDETVS